MQIVQIMDFIRSAGKAVYFRQIANWFPGDFEECEVLRKVQWLCRMGKLRRLEGGKYEVIE